MWGVGTIPQQHDNVILFPKTIDYYRQQVTSLLESEQYGETVKLLNKLIEAKMGDLHVRREWSDLLSYLHMMFPDGQPPEDEDEVTEEQLLQTHVSAKYKDNDESIERLLHIFAQPDQLERQIVVLDQLRYLRHPKVGRVIRRWLEEEHLPASIQFKGLQLLKQIGDTGFMALSKDNDLYIVAIEDTPLSSDEWPQAILAVIERLQTGSHQSQPELANFAEQIWRDFVTYAYGTALYTALIQLDAPGQIDTWAASLHYEVAQLLQGDVNPSDIFEIYGITEDMGQLFTEATIILHRFMQNGWQGASH